MSRSSGWTRKTNKHTYIQYKLTIPFLRLRNRLGPLPPCSCCALSLCFRRTGSSSSLSCSSPVSSGRFSSMYVLPLPSRPFFHSRERGRGFGGSVFFSWVLSKLHFNREYRPSARDTIPLPKGVSLNKSSRFGLTWCTCIVSVFRLPSGFGVT